MKKKLLTAISALLSLTVVACSPTTSSSSSLSSSSQESSSESSSSSSSEHTHVFESWSYDEHSHWKECECGEKSEEGEHVDTEEVIIEPTCETEGRKTITCTVCSRSKDETIDELGHDFSVKANLVAPTYTSEGSVTYECAHECGESVTYKILKLPKLELIGSELVWNEVDNASGYKFYKDDEEIDVGGLTSYQLSSNDLETEVFAVRAYTVDTDYVEYDELKDEVRLYKQGENVQALYNYDFEANPSIKLSRTASWNLYPYGNWSDLDSSGNGGYYFIETQEDGNTCLNVPAVVWYPGNTTVKKDLSRETAQPGTYEISFDIKASHDAMTQTANGKYGAIAMYMWNDCDGRVGTSEVTKQGSWVVKDIANEDAWSNVRVRYTINSAGTYNQFNLIYWPENTVSTANCIYLDNIEVYKVSGDTVIEENIDTLEGGDLEKWSTNPMSQNMWYANDTVLIENSARGSSFVQEDNNQALKIQANVKEAAFNLKGNAKAIGEGGMFEMNFRLKRSSGLKDNPAFGFTMWSFKGASQPCQIVDVTPIEITNSKVDEYTDYTVRFLSKGHEGCESINIYFWIELDNEAGDDDKFIIIDDVAIYSIDTHEDVSTNMLYIGNSHGDDTIEYIYHILNNINYDKEFTLYTLFIGGSTVEQHYNNFVNKLPAYELRYWDASRSMWATVVGVSIQTALSLENKWDYVCFQQSSRYIATAGNLDHLDELTAGVRDIVGDDTEFGFNAPWSYRGSDLGQYANPLAMYEANAEAWKTHFIQDNIFEIVHFLPTGTAIQNMRQKYTDSQLLRDNVHLSFGFGRFVASLTFVEYFLADVSECTYKPSDTNDAQLADAIYAAKAAIASPYEVTAFAS